MSAAQIELRQLDPREVMRRCASLGLVVGIALVGRRRQDLLLRMDEDGHFQDRVVDLLVRHVLRMAAADRKPPLGSAVFVVNDAAADFHRLIDSVVAAAEPPA